MTRTLRSLASTPSKLESTAKTPPKVSNPVQVSYNSLTFRRKIGFESTTGYVFWSVSSMQPQMQTAQVSTGTEVTPYFDPLICKLIVTGPTREQAVSRMARVLKDCKVFGPPNNLAYLASICDSTIFKEGNATTRFLDTFDFSPRCV